MHADTTRPQGKVVAPISLHCKGDTYCTVPPSALHVIPYKMATNMNIQDQYEFAELRLIMLTGAKATRAMRHPKYPYYYLACPCNLGCGCFNRTRAWPLPTQRCFSMEMLDRACRERLLQQIGYDIIWHCKECDLPSSCGGLS